MEGKLGQSLTALLKCEKLILSEEETTSACGCGVFLEAFSCPEPICLCDSAARGFFLSFERRRHACCYYLIHKPDASPEVRSEDVDDGLLHFACYAAVCYTVYGSAATLSQQSIFLAWHPSFARIW